MANWFDRLLGRDGEQQPAVAPQARTSSPGTPRPPAPAPEKVGREEILEALQLEMPETPPAPPDLELANRVTTQFRETHPVPGSPPQLAMRILNQVQQPDADAAELAKLISLEPALTAAVLRVANSAAYRSLGRIDSVRDAITRLGMREVARIGCALSAKSVFDPQRRTEQALFGPAFLELFIHASTTALAAASLALSMPKMKTRSDVVFLGGLLHDIGMSVGLRVLAGLIGNETPPRQLSLEGVQAILDAVHIDIGAEVHREWRLPDTALQICLEHHIHGCAPSEHSNELHMVRLASSVHLLQSRKPTEDRLAEVEESAYYLGLSKFQLRSFDGDVKRFVTMAQQLGS